MDTKIFEEIGFTPAEVKVYLALLKTGDSTAGPIIDQSQLQNSVVHLTLNKLIAKGFVSFIKKGKVKHYRAADPKVVLESIKEKEDRFNTLLPELFGLQKNMEVQSAEIFEGFKGFKNMLNEFIIDAKKGDEYLFFAFHSKNPDDFENVYNYYKYFEKERLEKGLDLKGISPSDIKDNLKGRIFKNIIFVDFPTPLNMSIFKDKVIFTPWGEKQVSFLIRSKQMAEMFRIYFYSIWNQYHK